jgi:toxin HigB-1
MPSMPRGRIGASTVMKPASGQELDCALPGASRRDRPLGRGHAQPPGPPRALTLCVINASRYYMSVLRSFKDRETEAIWHRQRSRLLDGPTQRVAWRKLAMLDAAETLADLRIPPGNRLEKLRGNREGQHSIRVNQQWRICFSWSDAGPEDVEIVDYH